MVDPEPDALLARIEDLEDVLSLYEPRANGRSIPWDTVKVTAGLPPPQ